MRVFDDDTETTDDLIDVMQFEIRSPSLGENYTYLSATGQNNLGTLVIAYNISCLTGYTGEDCSQSIDNSNTTGQNKTLLLIYHVLLAIQAKTAAILLQMTTQQVSNCMHV